MARYLFPALIIIWAATGLLAQEDTALPANEKAQKTYKEGLDYLHQRMGGAALDDFKKADKQSDGRCVPCQKKMIKYGVEFGEWKTAETACEELVAEAHGAEDTAVAHYQFGLV